MIEKEFNTEDVLSCSTSILCGKIDGVYQVMSFMMSQSLMTHQLPAAFDIISPIINEQHPQLKDACVDGLTQENIAARTLAWRQQFGDRLKLIQPENVSPISLFSGLEGKDVVLVVAEGEVKN